MQNHNRTPCWSAGSMVRYVPVLDRSEHELTRQRRPRRERIRAKKRERGGRGSEGKGGWQWLPEGCGCCRMTNPWREREEKREGGGLGEQEGGEGCGEAGDGHRGGP